MCVGSVFKAMPWGEGPGVTEGDGQCVTKDGGGHGPTRFLLRLCFPGVSGHPQLSSWFACCCSLITKKATET